MLNLIQINERLKKQPDGLVVAAANGQIPQIPPFMASAELLRRKQMREDAAATQAAEQEGAPTVTEELAEEVASPRQMKEQIAGLMALQGNRQQQAARQQAGIQAAMPMSAPNTTTSEPAQLAGGGFIDDIVVPRDYAAGGVAGMDPTMLKKLALMRAMKNQPRKAGLPSIPVNMFRRQDYAGGGIVAFDGTEGSFVESRPGFYELEEEMPVDRTEEEKDRLKMLAALPPEARGIMEIAKRVRERSSPEAIAARRKAAGLPAIFSEMPDTSAKMREDLARQKQALEESDTFTNRFLALQPGQFKTGITGRSALEYDKNRLAKMNEINKAIATAEDLREKARLDFAEGRFKESETGMAAADKAEMDAYAKVADVKYKEKLGSQYEMGRASEDRSALDYLRARRALGDTRPDAVILDEGRMRYVREKAKSTPAEVGQQTRITAEAVQSGDKKFDDPTSIESRDMTALRKYDRENGTNYADQYRNWVYESAQARIENKPLPALPPEVRSATQKKGKSSPSTGSTPPLPPGFVRQ